MIEFTRNVRFKKHIQGTWTMNASQLDATVTPSDGNNTITLYNDEADSVVKQYFDPAISNFYFFDGEKLADFFYTPLKNLFIILPKSLCWKIQSIILKILGGLITGN